MKPMLSPQMILGGAAVPVPRGANLSPGEDLDHRLVQIVWANGEGLDTPVPTRATALLQHGFKEWSGARGVSVVERVRAAGADVARIDPTAVWQAVQQCEAQNWMPLVLCHDLQAPLHVLHRMLAEGSCALMALGTPSSLRLAPRWPGLAGLAGPAVPLPLPAGVEQRQCLWLGAPDGLPRPLLGLPAGWRVAGRELLAQDMAVHLRAADSRLVALAPASLWCVLFIDDVVLGELPGTASEGLPPAALAATLRWLQRLVPSVAVFMVSHERVTAAQRGRIAELARHLGGGMYRHAGVRREPFAASLQKKR